MNNTEWELISKEKLFEMYENLKQENERLQEEVDNLEADACDNSSYEEGLAEGKEIGYNDGYDAGYEDAMKECEGGYYEKSV